MPGQRTSDWAGTTGRVGTGEGAGATEWVGASERTRATGRAGAGRGPGGWDAGGRDAGGRGAGGSVLAGAVARLAAAGVDSPRADAEQLAAHALGVARGALVLASWSKDQVERFDELVGRRAARIPLQYLVGTAGFRHLELAVGPGVFVPRPETEAVVEAALARIAAVARPWVVDLCAGSGAIALAVAHEHAGAEVLAVESDPGAADWARRNIEAAGLPVRLLVGDVEDAPAEMDGSVDLVVSNPPYIAAGTTLPPEVARHEPPQALFAGTDGLTALRAVERVARRLVRPGGSAVVEHGDTQAQAVAALFARWDAVTSHRDLAGRDRFVTARR